MSVYERIIEGLEQAIAYKKGTGTARVMKITKEEFSMELPAEKYYTFADVLSWSEDVRAEIIDGELYMMSAPSIEHQRASMALSTQIYNFLLDKPCEVFAAPFGVRPLEKDGDTPDSVHTLVEPDIAVVCDKSKLDKRGCKGAPDFIIEILSPSTTRHDRFVKLNLYNMAKVREYWIVDPLNASAEVYLPDETGRLTLSAVYTRKDSAPITVLPGCDIDLSRVFSEETEE